MTDPPLAAFTCFAHPLGEVAACVTATLEAAHTGRAVVSSTASPDCFQLPEQAHNRAEMAAVVWEPRATLGSTIFASNLEDGWTSLVHSMTSRFLLTCAEVRVSALESEWPIVELHCFENGSETRLLRAMKDDPKWEFFERGDPLPFEDPSFYANRLVRDRFPRQLLYQYLQALGWDPTDAGLWEPNGDIREIRWAAV